MSTDMNLVYHGVDPKEFEKQIQKAQELGFTISSLGEIVRAIKKRESIKDTITFSFDDGLRKNLPAAEILEQYDCSGTFGVITQTLEEKEPKAPIVMKVQGLINEYGEEGLMKRIDSSLGHFSSEWQTFLKKAHQLGFYSNEPLGEKGRAIKTAVNIFLPGFLKQKIINTLFEECFDETEFCQNTFISLAEINELVKKGMEIASHSRYHFWLTTLDYPTLKEEIEGSYNDLLRLLGIRSELFIYPYGLKTVSAHIKELVEQNFLGGVNCDWWTDICRQPPWDPFNIPRIDQKFF